VVIRTVFLGTPEFSVPTLEALIHDPEISVDGVFTQPDRPAGRGQRLTAPPVKKAALAAGIPVFQPEKFRSNPEAVAQLRQLDPDVCVVVAFGQILTPDFFALPPHGSINVHASVLPSYRGASPIVHSILNGDAESGVTIMRIDAGMDTGDILSIERVPIPVDMTAGELEEILSRKGADLLLPTLKGYLAGEVRPVPQPDRGVSTAPRIRKGDGRIDWSRSAREVHDRIRAMNPWPGAAAEWRAEPVKLWRSCIGEGSGPPGTVLRLQATGVEVACGEGSVQLTELQLPNRSRIAARDFVNGLHPRIGERFS
jgi:methionyl-tRNA formyltransferase